MNKKIIALLLVVALASTGAVLNAKEALDRHIRQTGLEQKSFEGVEI